IIMSFPFCQQTRKVKADRLIFGARHPARRSCYARARGFTCMKRRCLGTAFALLLLTAGASWAAEAPAVSQPAPDFSLKSQEGTPVSLKDYRGKWVVLYFYPKDMTQGCTIEAHNFQQDLPKYTQANAVIVGVSVDSTDSHKEFCAKESLTFKLLSDTDKKVVEEYGSLSPRGMALRNTFLVDPSPK